MVSRGGWACVGLLLAGLVAAGPLRVAWLTVGQMRAVRRPSDVKS